MTLERADDFEHVGAVSEALNDLGLMPVLVGGMALVIPITRTINNGASLKRAAPLRL